MIKIELKGADQLKRRLADLQSRAEALQGPTQVTFNQLFPPSFMTRHTRCASIAAFFAAGGFHVNSAEDLAHISPGELDGFVAKETSFPDWAAMKSAAHAEYVKQALGL